MERRLQLMELWEETFGDSREFTELLFDRKQAEDHALTIEENRRILSVLYMLPYQMNLEGTEIPVAYVCGVATRQEERGKGLMRSLMEKAEKVMKEKGYVLSVLIPAEKWLFDYYRKLGYTELFDYSLHSYRKTSLLTDKTISITTDKDISPAILFDYFDKKLHQRPFSILHDYEDFLVIKEDVHLSGGELFVSLKEEQVVGLAFLYPEPDGGFMIKELLYENEQVKDILLETVTEHFQLDEISYKLPVDNSPVIPYGMGRVIKEMPSLTSRLFEDGSMKAYMSLMLD